MKPDTYDHLERRCPRLGGPVSFGYCRTAGEDRPQCGKIIDCWWEMFDVKSFLHEQLSEEAFNALLKSEPVSKIASLVDIIARAKKAMQRTAIRKRGVNLTEVMLPPIYL